MINPLTILNRHLLLEMVPPFLINLAFFSFIFLMKQILDITDMIVNHKVGVGPVGLLLVYSMPYFLQYVVPMSVMMAVLLALLRMSGDNEILALKAGGVSLYRLLPPVLLFSCAGALLTGYMTIAGVPQGAERFRTLLFDVATANLNVSLKERTFTDHFAGIMLYANKIDPHGGTLQQVLIEDSRESGINHTVVARSGILLDEPGEMVYYLRLFDGTINQFDIQDRSSHTIYFDTYDIRLDLTDVVSTAGIYRKRPADMTLADLRAHLEAVKDHPAAYHNALVKYHRKFSIPLACLAMGLLALPLGVQSRHANKAFGIGLGLLFFLLYYLLLSVGTTLGETGDFPPLVGMWVPNLTLGGMGIWLLVRSAREKPLPIHFFQSLLDRAVRVLKP